MARFGAVVQPGLSTERETDRQMLQKRENFEGYATPPTAVAAAGRDSELDSVAALRAKLWLNGYPPVPVYSPEHDSNPPGKRGKRPIGNGWQGRARLTPPEAATAAPDLRALNTGILCDGFRNVDVDIDDAALAGEVRALAVAKLGYTIWRSRADLPRGLLLYRAAYGKPGKVTIEGATHDPKNSISCKVEVLGFGQQFVAYGQHESGKKLNWFPVGPADLPRDELPAVAEDKICEFLEEVAKLIGAQPPGGPGGGNRGEAAPTPDELLAAFPDDLAVVVSAMPNDKQFDDRTVWTKLAHGLAAAFANDPGRARELWLEHAHKRPQMPDDAAEQLWDTLGDQHQTGWAAILKMAGEYEECRVAVAHYRRLLDGKRATDAFAAEPKGSEDATDWPEPLDFLADAELTGAPELRPEHLPEAIGPFVFDSAARMGVDPAAVALAALVSLASVIDDDWRIQPKENDDTWTENPRIWGAIVGDPSMLKTPIIRVTTAPIDKLETQARERHEQAMLRYRCDLKAWKDAGSDPELEPKHPRLDRYMVEGTTTDALTEVLRDDYQATQRAPAGKVLIRQDEMAEWVASFDRYRSGGKGSADRGAYLRLYNGGRHTIDRVGRGAFAMPNWSACILGGIQPGPIQAIAKNAADDGLLQRFCYCVPARQSRGEDRRPDSAALARYAALFPALAALHPTNSFGVGIRPVVLRAEAHAHRLTILDLAEALAAMPDASDRLKSALGKWPGLWARITLLFHLTEMADARARGATAEVVDFIGVGAAAAATSYMRDILLPHLLRAEAIMFATEQTGHAGWIASFILAHGESRIAARDIVRNYRPLRAPESRRELLETMASMEAMGWVRAEAKSGHRQPTAWQVNTKVHSTFAERAGREKAERQAAVARVRKKLALHSRQGG